jgi:hypothetical protein
MITHSGRIAIGVASLGIVALLTTSAPASAGQFHVIPVHGVATTKGSDPGSAFCKAGAQIKKAALKNSAAEEKDFENNNWAGAKKIILADYASEASQLKKFESIFNGLPAKVKAAEETELKQLPAQLKIIQKSTTLAQFTTAVGAIDKAPKILAAEKVMLAYSTGLCGSSF